MSAIENIVDLEQVKSHLRYDFDDEDLTLTAYISAASMTIHKHVDADLYDPQNPQQKQAALLLIGYWDANRNSEDDRADWYLPRPVLVLLSPYRTPTAV